MPERVYKNKGWKDLGDWLGTYSISTQNRAKNYLPFKEAEKEYQKLAKQYHLVGISDWRRFVRTHKKLLDDLRIPVNPWNTYTKEQVWKRKME